MNAVETDELLLLTLLLVAMVDLMEDPGPAGAPADGAGESAADTAVTATAGGPDPAEPGAGPSPDGDGAWATSAAGSAGLDPALSAGPEQAEEEPAPVTEGAEAESLLAGFAGAALVPGALGLGGEAAAAPEPAAPLEGVLSPQRLQVVRPSITVTGRVLAVRAEPEGEVQIRLRPDLAFVRLVNDRNRQLQGGALLVRVVPTDLGRVPVPPVGARVRVTGTYVVDRVHGWLEVHPARSIGPAVV